VLGSLAFKDIAISLAEGLRALERLRRFRGAKVAKAGAEKLEDMKSLRLCGLIEKTMVAALKIKAKI